MLPRRARFEDGVEEEMKNAWGRERRGNEGRGGCWKGKRTIEYVPAMPLVTGARGLIEHW
jgi:hypothetical protein